MHAEKDNKQREQNPQKPVSPDEEVGDRPENAGQHPGLPPEINAARRSGRSGYPDTSDDGRKQPVAGGKGSAMGSR